MERQKHAVSVKKNKETEIYDKVDVKKLPKFSELNEEVQKVVKASSWWDFYGVDWFFTCVGFLLVFFSFVLMQTESIWKLCIGIFIYGCCHAMVAVRCAHAAVHNTVCKSKTVGKFWAFFFSDVCSTFSADVGYDMHIKCHHPHTNIIGLGDSSTWKIPVLPAYTYMFITPVFLPLAFIPVSINDLWGQWLKLARYSVLATLGLSINFYLLMSISGFSLTGAFLCIWTARAVLTIPYIHVNIFQHIGLSMYHEKSRPSSRLYQMSTAVLNLPRNPILDWTFGHSIISCHIEHHLFPKLSDNMCLKIRPLVSKFLKENGLSYQEDSYTGRLRLFLKNYDELMVNAPPITHFVGIQ